MPHLLQMNQINQQIVFQIDQNIFLYLILNNLKYFYIKNYELDFKDIKGQSIAKRAALISATGNHNIILD